MSEADTTRVQTVDINDVKYIEELYPRDEVDEETVKKYQTALDDLPPITLAADMSLIDGMHRMRAHRAEGEDTIEAEILDLDDRDEIFKQAIERNADHGKQLTYSEKASLSRHLRREFNYEHSTIAEVVGASESSVKNWCSEVNRDLRAQRRQNSYDHYLDHNQYGSKRSVADALDASPSTVSNDLDWAVSNKDKIDHIGHPLTFDEATALGDGKEDEAPWLRWGNVWRFTTVNKDFGADWSGRIPGQIVQNLLIHYTDPYDLVVDPMAGGGTTVDVCKSMARRYAAFDVNPLQDKGIQEADTTEEIPVDSNEADLVFMDPPYGRLMDDDYAEGGISSATVDEWVDLMSDVLEEAQRVTKSGGTIALLMEPFMDEDETDQFQDLTFKCMKAADELGLEQVERIATPLNLAHKTQRSVEHAKENNLLVDHNRDLVVWEVADGE